MKSFKVVLLFCIVQICTLFRSTDTQYISFGSFFENRPRYSYGSAQTIGGLSDVAQDLKLGQNCQIGSYCKISSGCSMGDNVRVADYVRIDQGSSIGSNCQLLGYATLGRFVTMGANNLMNPYAGIEENAEIESGCIMGMHSKVGPSAKLDRNVYAGDYSLIGSNSVIGENSIIQPYAKVPDNGNVGPNEMVIKTPTTSELYKNGLPINQIPPSDVELADQGEPEEFNERARQLMSSQKQKMRTSCEQNVQNVDFQPLRLVISLYLIRCDGLDQFTQNKQQGFGNADGGFISLGNFGIGISYTNGRGMSGSDQKAGEEKHFVEGAPKKVLEPALENDMVELLALKEDSQRRDRVHGDTFCKTVSEVQNKQRKVKCDQSVDIGSPKQGSTNGQREQPSQPKQSNSGYGESANNSPTIPSPTRDYQAVPNKPNDSMIPNVPHNEYPVPSGNPTRSPAGMKQPTTSANSNGPERIPNTNSPNRGYPNVPNVPHNQYPVPSGDPTSSPAGITQPTTSYPSNSNGPERIPDPNAPNRGYPNMPQSPYTPSYPSNNNQPDSASNNNQSRQPNNNADSQPECNQCNIESETSFGRNVELGDNLKIGESTTVGNNCEIKNNAIIGRDVKINSDSVVSENVNIGNNCLLDDRSKVGPNANIARGTYVGKNCEIGANAFIGENAVVLDNAKVPDNGNIESNQVMMPTPTSADLYSSCAPIEEVPQNVISQPDPNNNLRQMMRGQIAKVRSYCQQPQQLLDFAGLASAKTIYLIGLHGVPNFTNNRRNVMNKSSGNTNYDSKAYEKLMTEDHFVGNGQHTSGIEPDVKGEMIIMLAIEQDFGRRNRVPGDTFCQTFMEIASNQRQVKCDKQ